MKKSIQNKLFFICILLVFITSISISIPFYYLTKQDKKTAQQLQIHVAFEIIRDDVLGRIKKDSLQIDEFLDQVSAIPWGLKWYQDIKDQRHFFSSSTYSSYIITIGEEFLRFSRLVAADRLMLYGADKRLIVSYQREGDKETVGTYIVTPEGQNEYLLINDYSQFLIRQRTLNSAPVPLDLNLFYEKDFPEMLVSEHFNNGRHLGMRISMPVFHRGETVGLLILETCYTQELAQRYAALSKTEVNVFAGNNWSIGTLPIQAKLEPLERSKEVTLEQLLQLGISTTVESITIDGKSYYQGRYDFINAEGVPVGSITSNLSQEFEKAEIKKIITTVFCISVMAITLCFLLIFIFSRKTIRAIRNLTKTTSAIADGNLDEPIDTVGSDELGVLARSFAKMQKAIKNQITELNSEIVERKQAEEIIREREQEKVLLEKKLHQAQKMEAIGTLAGGIAHDFNNILSVILGYTDLLKNKRSDDSHLVNSLEQIGRAGIRAKNLVSQILAFSRQNAKELVSIRPDMIINEALELLRASIPTTIQINTEIKNCGSIIADPTELHQIVMNLGTNAYHAMRDKGGKLNIKLDSVFLELVDAKALSDSLHVGEYLRLEINDTGQGIDKATQLKIFDPYFTTKKKGDGTGLGLAVVHGVVRSFGGHISVYSELGQGTTFIIYFPKAKHDADALTEITAKPFPTGSEHILLVDDEDPILQLEKEMLEGLGYQTTICHSSPEALAIFIKNAENIDLIITDMTMPEMTGVELIQKVWREKPGMPVILCSGFSDLIDEVQAKNMGIARYLMKPVLQRDIAEAVRDVLD